MRTVTNPKNARSAPRTASNMWCSGAFPRRACQSGRARSCGVSSQMSRGIPMRTFLKAAAFLTIGVGLAFGQQPTFHDPLLDHLAGNWVLQGTIAGKETTHDVEAAWVLN